MIKMRQIRKKPRFSAIEILKVKMLSAYKKLRFFLQVF